MQSSHRICATLLFLLSPLASLSQAAAPSSNPPQEVTAAPQTDAALKARPAPGNTTSILGPSTIDLDVVVTDKSGKPVGGLGEEDFTLLDNNQPSKILSFHAYDSASPSADRPVVAMVLFDTVNTPFNAVSYTREQVENFLRLNGGHLPVPVRLAWLTNDGIEDQPEPSLDGNALAAQLEASESRLRDVNRSAGAWGAIERFQFSANMLDRLVSSEVNIPGRKLLIWASPGWPLLDGPNINLSSKGEQALFGNIVRLSTLMRVAHVDLYSISQGMSGPDTFLYESFLKPVKKANQVQPADLNLKVLAVQSGGRVLPPTNDLSGAIRQCVQDAGPYYAVSIAPGQTDATDQYHELKVHIDKPGLTARTTMGYYGQQKESAGH
jgi:VWFA-related protein